MPEAKGRHDREVSTGFPAHEFCSQWSIQDRKQIGLFEEREISKIFYIEISI
jgi:hypothetical protein